MWGLTQRRAIAEQMAAFGSRRFGLLPFLAFVLLFTIAAYFRLRAEGLSFHRPGEEGSPGPGDNGLTSDGSVQDYHANFAWLPLLVIVGLAAVGYAAWRLSSRRRAAAAGGAETVAESLAEAIEDTLDDLRAERDPRRAIIAAYARMERALAAFGLPRGRAETQREHVARILGGLEIDPAAIRRLTELFAQAKFSDHELGPGTKEEAIAALEQVRDALRAVQERRARELDEQSVSIAQA